MHLIYPQSQLSELNQQELEPQPQRSMKLNLDSNIQSQKSTPFVPIEEIEIVDAVEEDAVEEEEVNHQHQHLVQGDPNIQTFQQGNGLDAVCISNMVGVHIFVPNPPLALGKMSTPSSHQNNETQTSSAPLRIHY